MFRSISLLFTLLLAVQAAAQKPEVILSVNPQTVGVGESFTITVKSINVQGKIDIDNLPSAFSYGYGTMNGMEQDIDYNSGQVLTYYYTSQTGVISTPGTYTIGPAYIKTGKKTYASKKIKVTVKKQDPMSIGSISPQQFQKPVFGMVQTNRSEVYEGEPIILEAKIYSRFHPKQLKGYRPYEMQGSPQTESLGKKENITVQQETYQGDRFYSFEYDRKLVFPASTGKQIIDPFKMQLQGDYKVYPFNSSAGVVEVKPLPGNPPSNFIGGVGNFKISRTIDTNHMTQGDVFQLSVTVEGKGNLQNILPPKLTLPKGFAVYGDPVMTEMISYGLNGAEGRKNYEFNIQVSKYGKIALPATTISFFDPIKEKYIESTTLENELSVARNPQFVVTEIEEKETQKTEIIAQVQPRMASTDHSTNTLYGSALFWSGVGTPLFGALFFIIAARRKEQHAEELIAKTVIKEKGKQSNAYLRKSKELMHDGDNDDFFSNVELALKRGFEVKMNFQEERILNKLEIYAFLDATDQQELKRRVQELFATSEASRFGFGSTNATREESYDALVSILKSIES